MDLKSRIQEDMKTALRAQDKQRLGAVRLILAAIKQKEVDERIQVDDSQVIAILDKMLKQRRDSLEQFQAAGRNELVAQEAFEIEVINTYLPTPLTEAELIQLIRDAKIQSGANDIKDTGKVMGILKSQIQGRADMRVVSDLIKQQLS